MKLQDYKPPFRLYGEHCIQGSGGDVVPYLSAGLVGEFIDILNAHFAPKVEPKAVTPEPNRKETDAVAAKYYESGRKLEVQFWDSKQWTQGDWEGEGRFTPTFDYSLPWRIKPTKRRVVVDVFTLENSQPFIFSESGSDGAKSFRSDKACKFVGTIKGEVEA